ncbi:MAG: dihydrolipoyl dehydrogenase [Burkholderiaceae bacterium]|jgi:dihydrolipoamide dehydrogenase|nr:dihydrolipoyl dehydrogenase [Burkholderiaceae bacterium]
MAPFIEVKVPDIGDFKDVAVIEIMVKPGDVVRSEQSLITVESDKASMEIPASAAGVVKEMKVRLGDKVSEGSTILLLEASDNSAATTPAAAAAPTTTAAAPGARAATGAAGASLAADVECDVLVLGGGPGGYSAAFRAADLGLKAVIVERYATLGGVCLNVGCIPSKALLHVATVMDEFEHLAAAGIDCAAPPRVDIARLRAHKEKIVNRLTSGLDSMAKMRKVRVVRGVGRFVDAHHVRIEPTQGAGQAPSGGAQTTIGFKNAIIAVGSQAVRLPFLPQDARIVDSTGALALTRVPQKMLIVGGGIIGLEMGTVYSALGARLDVVEMLDGLMPGADRDLVKVWQKRNAPRFDHIMLKTRTVAAKATAAGVQVTFEGEGAPPPQTYDLVLQAVGRAPNGQKIGADKAGVEVTARGFIPVDAQMRTSAPHIFAIGDVVGQPMLAHKAVHEGHVAAEVIAGELTGDARLARAAFDARAIPSVAYTDPEVAWAGLTEEQARAQGIQVRKGLFPWSASGRAIANGRDEGFTKLLFDDSAEAHGQGRILGGGIVGTHAGDMIGEIALAIEMGADAVDIGNTIHPHPTLGESLGMAAEAAHGACTDLPPQKR